MDFSLIEEKLSSYGSGGHYLLEAYILQLLKTEADSRNQPFEYFSNAENHLFDAFAPKGMGEIDGPVLIEIVQRLSLDRFNKEIQKHLRHIRNQNTTLLLISPSKKTDKEREFINQFLPGEIKVTLWGTEEIQLLMQKHSSIANELSEKLFSNRFRIAIENNAENWKEQRQKLINIIITEYQTGRFSLLLGAGVSSSAGLPDWDTLLNSLFVSMLMEDGLDESSADPDQTSSIVKRLRQMDGPSALMLARYIRKGITADSAAEQGKFIATVTAKLYELRNKKYSISSDLIKSIANLCVPSRTGANVRAVLTYNFDDLLERELKEQGLTYRSIFEEIELPSPEELPIYHAHGFLPEDRSQYSNIDKATLVFSEEGYHHIYRDAYHWSNLIQLNSLKETSCLMIGLSLTDPNLRRLLEISAKTPEKPRHFAFMRRVSYEKFHKDGDKTMVRAPAHVIRKFLERHHNLNEAVMKELGVNIIWYENYDEIPKILRDIKKGI